MALPTTGVQYVSKGFAEFIKNMSKASQSIVDLGNMTKNRLAALNALNKSMSLVAKYAKDVATSNDKVIISNNALKSKQEQVKISANNLAKSQNALAAAQIRSAHEGERLAVAMKRLEMINTLNEAFLQGALSLKEYDEMARATNNSMDRLGSSAATAGQKIYSALQGVGGALGSFGGIFGTVTNFANLGASMGSALGSFIPALGTAVGGIIGYLGGAIAGIGAAIVKGIAGLAVSIGRAVLDLGKKILNWIVGIFKGILSVIGGFFTTIFNMLTGGIFQQGWNNLGNTIFGAMFKFEVLKQIIRGVVNEIRELSKSALQGAIDLQTLTARLDFLIASQVRFAGKATDFASAMAIAKGETQELLKWIQRLALASPVSVDDVSRTTSMAIAMGWNAQSAKELTSAIVDYTAATGLGSEISERIIYNFAQMRQQGKVTGTELRDLGRGAFMPITKILEIMYTNLKNAQDAQKQFNGTFQEFRDLAATGALDVEEFFKAFNQYVNEYMPGAAEKMNYTFAAIKDNLQDLFKSLLGWNVIGPMLKEITKPLQDLITRLGTADTILAAQRIGQGMAYLVRGMKAGIEAIINAFSQLLKAAGIAMPSIMNIVQTLVKLGLAFKTVGEYIGKFITNTLMNFASGIGVRFGDQFNSMRKDFFTWGANLVISFAEGMLRAAKSVLVTVINFIGRILTSWFSTHSPPKILPDIGIWGMETINEWLHGFTEADFTALDSLQNAVKEALGALVNVGLLSDKQSSDLYSNISVGLIQAFDEFNRTGTISTNIFQQLRDIGGAFGQEIAELLDMQLQLAMATEQATQAQEAYDNAVKATQRSEVKTNRLIREYNAMLRKGASKLVLKDKLKLVNASEMELDANRKAEIANKEALDLAQEQQKAIENTVKLQEQLIKQLTELYQKEKNATGGAGDLADAIEALGGEIDLGFDITPPWDDTLLQQWITLAEQEFNAFFLDNKKKFSAFWYDLFQAPDSDFQKAIGGISTALQTALASIKTIWDTYAPQLKLPFWEEFEAIWNKPLEKKVTTTWTGTGFETQTTYTNTFIDKITETLQLLINSINDESEGGIGGFLKRFATLMFSKLSDAISNAANNPEVKLKISQAISGVLNTINDIFSGNNAAIVGPAPLQFGNIMEDQAISGTAEQPLAKLTAGLIKLLTNVAQGTLEGLQQSGAFENLGSQIISGIVKGMGIEGLVGGIAGAGATALGTPAATGILGPFASLGQWILQGILGGYQEGINKSQLDWDLANMDIYQYEEDYWMAKSPSEKTKDIGIDMATGLSMGYDDQVKSITFKNKMEKASQSILDNIKLNFGLSGLITQSPLYLIGQELIKGLRLGILSAYNSLRALLAQIGIQLPEIVADVTGTESPSKVFAELGKNFMLGMEIGVLDSVDVVQNALTRALDVATPHTRVMAPVPVRGGNSATFGDTYINNDMDEAMFKAKVKRWILEG